MLLLSAGFANLVLRFWKIFFMGDALDFGDRTDARPTMHVYTAMVILAKEAARHGR